MARFNNNGRPRDYYWAAAPTDEIGDHLYQRVEDFYDYCNATGLMALWRRMYAIYNSALEYGSEIMQAGEANELSLVRINQIRNLITHLANLTLAQRPSFQPA